MRKKPALSRIERKQWYALFLGLNLLFVFGIAIELIGSENSAATECQNINAPQIATEVLNSSEGLNFVVNEPYNDYRSIEVSVGELRLYDEDHPDGKVMEGIGAGHIIENWIHIYDATVSNDTAVYKGEFVFVEEDNSWEIAIPGGEVPPSERLYLNISFIHSALEEINYTVISDDFALSHTLIYDYSVAYDGEVGLSITVARLEYTYEGAGFGEVVPDGELTTHNYVVKNSRGRVVAEGELSRADIWQAQNVEISWSQGKHYVVLEFDAEFLDSPIITIDEPTANNSFERTNPVEIFLYFLMGVIGIILLIGLVLIIYSKKSDKVADVKSKDQTKELEILAIDPKKLKPTRLGKERKKVESIDENALIFDVPTWEVEDEVETEVSGQQYNLHCSKCSSWYETNEWNEELECPKCDDVLRIALWCPQCKVFVDVPEPGSYDCPECDQALQYEKA